jgi:hypothetical protein
VIRPERRVGAPHLEVAVGRSSRALQDRPCSIRVQPVEQHHEFLAADARDHMPFAARPQDIGDHAQHAVAHAVAMRVVDALEAVDVANGQADDAALLDQLASLS